MPRLGPLPANKVKHPYFWFQLYAEALGLPSARILLDPASSFRDQLRLNEMGLVEEFHTGWTFRLLGGAEHHELDASNLSELESFFKALNMLKQRAADE